MRLFLKLNFYRPTHVQKRTQFVPFYFTLETILIINNISLRGRRLKGKGKGVLGERENARGARGRREGNACQETIVFLVFNIYQANVKILIGQNLIRSK